MSALGCIDLTVLALLSCGCTCVLLSSVFYVFSCLFLCVCFLHLLVWVGLR